MIKFGLKINFVKYISTDYRKFRVIIKNNPYVLSFNKNEKQIFEKKLNDININTEKPLVLLGLRDMAYYQHYSNIIKEDFNLTKRIKTNHRCPDIKNYFSAIKRIINNNHLVLRMGLKVSNNLDNYHNDHIIDYASNYREDSLDIYLLSICKFVIAGDTGLFSGAAAFDKPSLISDLFLIRNNIYSTNNSIPNIFIPKLVLNLEKNRLLNFSETIHYNHFFTYSEDCENNGFKLVHNTPEEIENGCIELMSRINKEYIENDETKYLRKKFNNIYLPHQLGYKTNGVISEFFLKKYEHLLS